MRMKPSTTKYNNEREEEQGQALKWFRVIVQIAAIGGILANLFLGSSINTSYKSASGCQGGFSSLSPTMPPPEYDVCVVGAGLSGIVIAEQYASQLGKTSLILEKRDHIGGNCYDYVDKETGILMNKYGAHLFHTNHVRVWQYLKQFSDWDSFEHRVLAKIGDEFVPVPVNIDTVNLVFGLNLSSKKEMDEWLAKEQVHLEFTPKNSEEMALSRVGPRLYDHIFKPYTFKQWAKWPAELGPEVTARIPVRNNFDDRYFDDLFQALPAKGYTAFFQAMLHSQQELIQVKTNVDYFDVRDSLKCGKTYFTGPIDAYFAHLGWEKLEYRSLDFELQVKKNIGPGTLLPAAVVNYPSLDYNFTRIVEYKHMLNQQTNHTVLVLERSKDGGEPYYPIPNQRNKDLYAKYQAMAREEVNVTFVGRLANYKYFNMDEAIKNALEIFDQQAPKVMVRQYLEWRTGGPEALIQLLLGFHSWMPTRTFLIKNEKGQQADWYGWYPELGHVQVGNLNDLQSGDIYIIPEIDPCPKDLVQRGVRVFLWWLGQDVGASSNLITDRLAQGCEYFSHNFWLSSVEDIVRVPDSHVVLPYITREKSHPGPIVNDHRENLIIINGHDDIHGKEVQAAKKYCAETSKCTTRLISGFDTDGLRALYEQAKVVLSFCMRGSERAAIEAALAGVVLITNDCGTGSNTRDFPLPRDNIISEKNPIEDVLDRVLQNFEVEQDRMKLVRATYSSLGPELMKEQTKRFMHNIDSSDVKHFWHMPRVF